MSNHIKKALINTSALYGKIIINAGVALVTTRIALKYLGEIDFGLFSLIGGVVMMLSFLNGSLMQSTQRFLSISIGKGDNGEETKQVFNASIMLHILLSVVLLIIFLGAKPFLFDGFLNIPADRIDVAVKTYQVVVLTTAITFITIPYNAAINAREDMWFFAISDVVMSIMKFGAAIVLMFLPDQNGSLLVIYTALIMLSSVVSFGMKLIWCRKRYSECRVTKKYLWNKKCIKAQLGFTGWNSITSLATIGRNQGIAIVMNVFFGPAINAAYGIANQINSLVSTFASSLSTVFAPQIIQSYGANDNQRMLRLAVFTTKITLILSMVMCLPLIIEAHTILKIWLGEVPQYSSIFCKLIIIIFIVMQFYSGLVRCLYAQGDIKWYQISISIALILPVVVGYYLYKMYTFEPQFILYLMLVGQIATLCLTLYSAKKKVGLNIWKFLLSSVLKPALIFGVVYIIVKSTSTYIVSDILRLVFACFTSVILLTGILYRFLFDSSERTQLINMFKMLKSKIR